MATYFVVSDVHGYYEEMMKSLEECGFDLNNQSHIFVSCGDLCDRGPDAVKCLTFVNNLPDDRKILIRGNHEDLMEEAIARHCFLSHDYHNMTHDTAYQLTGLNPDDCDDFKALELMKTNELWNTYVNSCRDYYEDDKHIFVHGWIPVKEEYDDDDTYADLPQVYRPTHKAYNPDWRTDVWADDWKDARWYNGMKMWSMGIVEPNKTIYCGHWHTSWGHANLHHKGVEWEDYFTQIGVEKGVLPPSANKMHSEPFKDKGIVAIDACTAITHHVNCVKIGKVKKVHK